MSPLLIVVIATIIIFLLALWQSRNLLGSLLYALFPAAVVLLGIYIAIPMIYDKIIRLETQGQKMKSD